MPTRRNVLAASAAALGGLALFDRRSALADKPSLQKVALPGAGYVADGKHELPPLPYAYDALEPHIDAKTMQLHHDIHHKGYVDGLNEAEQALAKARDAGDAGAIGKAELALAFHGSGHANHTTFWNNMKPADAKKGAPEGALANAIARDFGSLDKMKTHLTAAAGKVEGNGWGMLAYHPLFRKLYVLSVHNHQNTSVVGAIPILVVDVWEHAYYLKYQNKRGDYIKAWWNVVDFADVEARYAAAARI
ncbi:superoxide dismutase [bacterium]|nr:superoxide dismutase [bacterium]